jgi:hypothetical protein
LPPGEGRSAAKDEARAVLAPTVQTLRSSVFGLLERMLPTAPVAVPEPARGVFTVSV